MQNYFIGFAKIGLRIKNKRAVGVDTHQLFTMNIVVQQFYCAEQANNIATDAILLALKFSIHQTCGGDGADAINLTAEHTTTTADRGASRKPASALSVKFVPSP